ncbi:MAG: GGDEF domain-containing protein [Candidatus Micrarchaeota archaeon]|nr:GGDEF domain-containing protein [Candidatus Micrarchaeota archaeon]
MSSKVEQTKIEKCKPKRPTTGERKILFARAHQADNENPYKTLADCQYDIIAGTTFEEDGLSETIRLGFQNIRGISKFSLYWCEGDMHTVRPYQAYSLNNKYEIIGKNFSKTPRAIGLVVSEKLLLKYLKDTGIAREKGIYGSIVNENISPPFGICWNMKKELLLLYDLNPYNKFMIKADKEEMELLKKMLEMPSGVILPLLYKKSLQGIVEITGQDLYFDGDTKNADSLVKYTTFMARVLAVHKKMQTDPLTKLLSKEVFEENLKKKAEEYLESGKLFSLLYIDGDNFKKINDTYGHHVGDKVLRNIAKKMFESTLPQDLNHRIGGEEFATITPVQLNIAVKIAKRIANNIRMPIEVVLKPGDNCQTISKTASIGLVDVVTAIHGRKLSADEIAGEMKRMADAALYKAKAEPGKGAIYAAVLEDGKVAYRKID